MRDQLIQKVKALNFPVGQYAVFGSGPMAVRGLRESSDIDLIVTPELFDLLKQDSKYKAGVWGNGVEILTFENLEIGKTWTHNDYEADVTELIKNAEIIDGVPFVQLNEVIKWKTAAGRDKDLNDIRIIEDYLRAKA